MWLLFFFKQKTAYEMRISDWSSDVCSSDLLGIAAATPRGLLVPNIKDAQDLSMRELARALQKLTTTAREGKATPADQQGGTITITNIGVFGMDAGTPIINGGEAGIVSLGTLRQKPWVVDGEVRPRWVTTVAVSYAHRVRVEEPR